MATTHFQLTDAQLDALSAEFRKRAVYSAPESHIWEAAARLLHQHRMAAAEGRSAKANAKRLRLQSREFAATL